VHGRPRLSRQHRSIAIAVGSRAPVGSTPRRTTRAGLLTALGALALLLGGCSSGVEVSVPAGASSPACAAVAARWPTTVGGKAAVETSPADPAVHAWGDPPVIARCGLPEPGPTTDQCLGVSGVDWVAHRLSDGVRFITYGRSPAVEVLVPSDYGPEPLLLGAFTRAAQAVPQGERRCSG
jgi:hypothetical protein